MKKWYQSKTIIVNIIAGILGVIPMIDESFLIAIGITNVAGYLSVIGVITTILNLILRMITNTQIVSNSTYSIGTPNVPKSK